ncbi:MAG: threonine synthase [Balneolaceae bacterium]|nr:threonine synthase [Balneolaceae bacterium]
MKYYSTKGQAKPANFRQAIFKGLPEDNGLYMPEQIPVLSPAFFAELGNLSLPQIGFEIMKPFIGKEIPDKALSELVEDTLNFDIPLKQLTEETYALELFHGPTFAFKDVGARFLARSLSYFSKQSDHKLTVLVATSGDTGSAVAQGFYDVANIEVVILYPSGKISHFQEQQMTTLGNNITALEVNGTFDDCQKLVKQAFLDGELQSRKNLTSANSINIARMLPQSIYYFYGMGQLPPEKWKDVVISVPSGNYGNLTAGLIAQRMGLPIGHFLACSNINDTVPEYLETATYRPRPSKQTISNAMDVGDPSNFHRILDLFKGSHAAMSDHISGYSYTDEETRAAINKVAQENDYVLDPHGAVGYLGLSTYLDIHSGTGIFLETAHPYKFKDVVEEQIDHSLNTVVSFEDQEKKSIPFSSEYEDFKEFLLES